MAIDSLIKLGKAEMLLDDATGEVTYQLKGVEVDREDFESFLSLAKIMTLRDIETKLGRISRK